MIVNGTMIYFYFAVTSLMFFHRDLLDLPVPLVRMV